MPFTNVTNANVLIANTTKSAALIARDVSLNWLELRQEGHGEEEDATYQGSNSVVYILRFGGVAATIAAVLTWRLARELRHR